MASESGKDKRGLAMTAIVVLLLTLMGAGIGFAVGLLLPGLGHSEAGKVSETTAAEAQPANQGHDAALEHGEASASGDEHQPAEEETTEPEIPLKDLKVIPFPPILTTLAEPKGKWIRLEGTLLVMPETEKGPELLAEEAGERILAYLRSLRLAEIESPSGFLGLRDDLNETVNVMSQGEVRSVLIHGLIIE